MQKMGFGPRGRGVGTSGGRRALGALLVNAFQKDPPPPRCRDLGTHLVRTPRVSLGSSPISISAAYTHWLGVPARSERLGASLFLQAAAPRSLP